VLSLIGNDENSEELKLKILEAVADDGLVGDEESLL
jgi:hypothetical protein